MSSSLLAGSPSGAEAVRARLAGLPDVDPAWSRTVSVPDASGVLRTWHLLDNGADADAGTLLCVHGNPTWSYLWRRHLATARPGWRVVAVDQLGMGFSERLDRPRRFADRVADLDALTAALDITGPVALAAHDWGGPIALGWALRHQAQLVGIVLGNTGVALPQGSAPPLIRLARSPALRGTVCVRTPVFVRSATALSRPPLPAPVRVALAAPYATAERRAAIGDFVADIPVETDHPTRGPLQEVAARLPELAGVPMLLQWGPRDPVFSQRYLRDLQQRFGSAAVHRYPRASHLVTEDAPEAAEHAWRWLDDLAGASGSAPTTGRERAQPPTPPLGGALAAHAGDPAPAVVELVGQERRVTSFAELEQRVSDLAAGLCDFGVRPGDRVGLLVPPGVDLTTAVYACWRMGAVIVVADAGLGLRGLRDALRSADPAYLIGVGKGLAAAAALAVPGRRILAGEAPTPARRLLGVAATLDELAGRGRCRPAPAAGEGDGEVAVLFTSGATGPAKGVVYRRSQMAAQLDFVRMVFDLGPEDRLVAAFAPFALFAPALGVGAAVPDMEVTKPGTLTAAALAEAVAAVDGTVVFASPAAIRNVVATASAMTDAQRQALRGVRRMMSAGAPVPVGLLRSLQRLVPAAELHTPYGMTEALPVTDVSLGQVEAAGLGNGVCVGWPLPGISVRISPLDAGGVATGALTDAAEVTGEICVAGPHVKDRYDQLWGIQRDSAREPGWHRTGDVGHLDAEGRLWVEGRMVHLIRSPEGPVTPVGIEQRLERLPEVRAAAAVGVGPAGTQQVVAVVVPEHPERGVLAPPDLAAAVRAAAGVPVAAVLSCGALPVDIRHNSKVDRARLARWAERVLAGHRPGKP